jgi:hypothetical protein
MEPRIFTDKHEFKKDENKLSLSFFYLCLFM